MTTAFCNCFKPSESMCNSESLDWSHKYCMCTTVKMYWATPDKKQTDRREMCFCGNVCADCLSKRRQNDWSWKTSTRCMVNPCIWHEDFNERKHPQMVGFRHCQGGQTSTQRMYCRSLLQLQCDSLKKLCSIKLAALGRRQRDYVVDLTDFGAIALTRRRALSPNLFPHDELHCFPADHIRQLHAVCVVLIGNVCNTTSALGLEFRNSDAGAIELANNILGAFATSLRILRNAH